MLKLMDAQTFSTFAAITCGNLGGLEATMSMIAKIVRVEIDWQLSIMRPLSSPNAAVTSTRPAAPKQRRPQPSSSRPEIPAALLRAIANAVVVPVARGQLDRRHHLRKRKRSMAEVLEAETEAERQPPRPPPEKRVKYSSPSRGYGPFCPSPPRRSTALEEKGGGGVVVQERAVPRRPPTPRPRSRPESRPAATLIEAAPSPYCALWERRGGRNVPSLSSSDNHDEDRGRAARRRL